MDLLGKKLHLSFSFFSRSVRPSVRPSVVGHSKETFTDTDSKSAISFEHRLSQNENKIDLLINGRVRSRCGTVRSRP